MTVFARISLIDRDVRRRAAVSHTLSSSSVHVEPFEGVAELAQVWPRADAIMLEDTPGAIAELNETMARQGEWLPVVAFGEAPRADQIVQAVLDGAIDYLTWPLAAEQLAMLLETAIRRAETVSNVKQREVIARSRVNRLTRREREVLGGVAGGLSNRLIAEMLSISPRTVEIHRANMLNKLGVNHTSEAIRIAVQADMIE